jgi:hypothetical protein
MSWDWFFSTTDNINLLIEIACGILFTAWVAGVRSKQRLVAYLESEESNPVVDRIVNAVVAKLPPVPKVPTVAEFVAAMPDVPDYTDRMNLLEERIGTKLMGQFQAQVESMKDDVAKRVGLVVQSHIASAKSAFSSAQSGLEGAAEESMGGMEEVLGIFMDEDSVRKLGRAKRLFKNFQARQQMKAGGGGAGGAPQVYPLGTILNGWVAAGHDAPGNVNGWVRLAQPAPSAPPPPRPVAPVAVLDAPDVVPDNGGDLPPAAPPKVKDAA